MSLYCTVHFYYAYFWGGVGESVQREGQPVLVSGWTDGCGWGGGRIAELFLLAGWIPAA